MPEKSGRLLLALLIGLVAYGPVSTDLYLPSLPAIGRYFGADDAAVQLTLSGFLVGFALAMLVHGPLSDRFGRRPVLMVSTVLFVAATIVCLLAGSIEAFTLARVAQGLAACAGPVVARAVVRDLYEPREAARVMSLLAAAMTIAPSTGPILGGFITTWFGWKANFSLLLIFGLICCLGICLALPETNRQKDPLALDPVRMAANYRLLLRSGAFLGYALLAAGSYAGIFTYISASSFVLIGGLKLSPDVYGFCFAASVASYASGSLVSARLARRLDLDRTITIGSTILLIAGAIAALLGYLTTPSVAAVVAPSALYFFGTGLVISNAFARAIGPHPGMAGAASALIGFLQMGFAAVFGAIVGQFQDGSPHALVTGLLAAALLTLAGRRLAPAGTAKAHL